MKVQNIASKLERTETEMEDQEMEQRRPVRETTPTGVRNTEEQDAGPGFFTGSGSSS